jgi:uncharacterized membrane protein YphA (DoxX/SURF4 family)
LGLLLLRSAVGVLVLVQGGAQLNDDTGLAAGAWISGILSIGAGASLLAGFMTPIAAALVALEVVAGWISVIPPTIFHSKPLVAFLLAVAVSVVVVGPGEFSVDARLFGLREIIIPRSTKSE